jgi:hypothetical protein
MDNVKREKEVSWMALVQKKDPSIHTRPVTTYVFDNGKRIFHKGKRSNSGTRKS